MSRQTLSFPYQGEIRLDNIAFYTGPPRRPLNVAASLTSTTSGQRQGRPGSLEQPPRSSDDALAVSASPKSAHRVYDVGHPHDQPPTSLWADRLGPPSTAFASIADNGKPTLYKGGANVKTREIYPTNVSAEEPPRPSFSLDTAAPFDVTVGDDGNASVDWPPSRPLVAGNGSSLYVCHNTLVR